MCQLEVARRISLQFQCEANFLCTSVDSMQLASLSYLGPVYTTVEDFSKWNMVERFELTDSLKDFYKNEERQSRQEKLSKSADYKIEAPEITLNYLQYILFSTWDNTCEALGVSYDVLKLVDYQRLEPLCKLPKSLIESVDKLAQDINPSKEIIIIEDLTEDSSTSQCLEGIDPRVIFYNGKSIYKSLSDEKINVTPVEFLALCMNQHCISILGKELAIYAGWANSHICPIMSFGVDDTLDMPSCARFTPMQISDMNLLKQHFNQFIEAYK